MTGTTAAERAQLASIALLVAEEAAALVSAGFRAGTRAEQKGPHDVVTEYDRASEAMITARLRSLAPGIPIVAEEETADRKDGARDGHVFYVDPLDGTANFVHGHPFWCVAIGLMEDERPVAGAVVAPMINVRWIGWAPAKDAPGQALRNGQPCVVSKAARLADAMLATGFPHVRDRAPEDNFGSFTSVKRKAQAVRRCGSAAMDLCMVADGTYDGYWERSLRTWDVAGGSAIVLGAGGRITSLDGGPPDYHGGRVVASNGLLHEELLATING
jgi:myo-inositol-1(or 4)-monophosphatase